MGASVCGTFRVPAANSAAAIQPRQPALQRVTSCMPLGLPSPPPFPNPLLP